MKIFSIAVLAILVAFSATVYSKGYGSRDMSPEQRVERMSTRLGLDESQQQQVLEIFNSTQEQRLSIQQQMQALHEQTRARIAEVLSAEQQATFEKMGPRGKARMD